jgi:hypothetical protein
MHPDTRVVEQPAHDEPEDDCIPHASNIVGVYWRRRYLQLRQERNAAVFRLRALEGDIADLQHRDLRGLTAAFAIGGLSMLVLVHFVQWMGH